MTVMTLLTDFDGEAPKGGFPYVRSSCRSDRKERP